MQDLVDILVQQPPVLRLSAHEVTLAGVAVNTDQPSTETRKKLQQLSNLQAPNATFMLQPSCHGHVWRALGAELRALPHFGFEFGFEFRFYAPPTDSLFDYIAQECPNLQTLSFDMVYISAQRDTEWTHWPVERLVVESMSLLQLLSLPHPSRLTATCHQSTDYDLCGHHSGESNSWMGSHALCRGM